LLPSWDHPPLHRGRSIVPWAPTSSVCDGPGTWTIGPTPRGTLVARSECSPTPGTAQRRDHPPRAA